MRLTNSVERYWPTYMKILIFSPYYPPHVGGVENFVQELSASLAKQKHEVIIFTPHIPVNTPEQELSSNIRVLRFPAFEIIPNYPIPKFWTKQFLKSFISLYRETPQIVVSQTRFFLTSLLALFYAKTKRLPWIHIEHGSTFVNLSSKLTSFFSWLFDMTFGRLVFLSSTKNICISKAVYRFVSRFDRRSHEVIYRGMIFSEMDEAISDTELRQTYAGKIIIATAARLFKWKGIDNTILAIQALPDTVKEKIVFLIIGDGEDRDRLEKIVTQKDLIVFTGNIPREKLFSILKICDIYIHSALPGGGLSTSLLEALYTGCAVIATPNEGADEVIKNNENGLLIKESSAKEISQGIIELVNNDGLRNKIRDGAKRSMTQSFSWDNVTKQYISLFEKYAK